MLPLPLISLLLGLLVLAWGAPPAGAVDLLVPGDFPTVQAAVNEADDGDVIVIAPGTYVENVVITGQNLTFRSESGDPTDTVIEAALVVDDNDTPNDPTDDKLVRGVAIEVQRKSSGGQLQKSSHVVLQGLTVANGESGVVVRPDCLLEFLDGRAERNSDGISLEGRSNADTHGLARAIVRNSVLEHNDDDGADSDSRSELRIEDSTIQDNDDDGIEIRLQDNLFGEDETIQHLILRNRLLRNGEDGLQLIDDETLTPRSFRIERNVFADNHDAGLGMMCDQVTSEDFEGCPLDEPVELVHNTFSGNDHGLTGGANLMGVNNLFAGHVKAVKNVSSPSLLSHTGLDTDEINDNSNLVASVVGDPRLTPTHELSPGSAAVDAGAMLFPSVEPILEVGPCDYSGLGPDLGASELDTGAAVIKVLDVALGGGSADAFEKSGKVKLGGKRLDLGKGGVAALRFHGIAIDPGAEVLTATLQLTAAKKAKKSASLQIHGEASDDAIPLGDAESDLSGRATTSASVAWSPPAWPEKGAAGPDQQTPNLASVVQEIVDRPGWAAGNALVFLVNGSGKRSVAALEGGGEASLHIELGASDAACAP